jgi:hypothetical protein
MATCVSYTVRISAKAPVINSVFKVMQHLRMSWYDPQTGHDCGLETLMADYQLTELPDIMQPDGGHVLEQNTAEFHPALFEPRSHTHHTSLLLAPLYANLRFK